MNAIKIISGTRAEGKPLAEGGVYKVPSEVSEADAKTLIQIGKAMEVAEVIEPEVKAAPTKAVPVTPKKKSK